MIFSSLSGGRDGSRGRIRSFFQQEPGGQFFLGLDRVRTWRRTDFPEIDMGLVDVPNSLWLAHDLMEERSMLQWASTSICWWRALGLGVVG
ncbi:hypothetical protein DY000_02052906 [Brassica cretica]|uniref:Uncharacterized protein n=1 Tax=Brassica cretica TaxID=69181 RepID=A0ABQ7A972_BRACR|nr:hypothetical protein DY000_02052906 [Brassica cretica]